MTGLAGDSVETAHGRVSGRLRTRRRSSLPPDLAAHPSIARSNVTIDARDARVVGTPQAGKSSGHKLGENASNRQERSNYIHRENYALHSVEALRSMDTRELETPPPTIIRRIDKESPTPMGAVDHNATPDGDGERKDMEMTGRHARYFYNATNKAKGRTRSRSPRRVP
jgi:hypothetical protein